MLACFVTPENQPGPTQQLHTPQSAAKKHDQRHTIAAYAMANNQVTGEDVVDGLQMFYGDGSEDAQLWRKKFQLHMLTRTATIAAAHQVRMAVGLFEGYMRPNELGERWLATLTNDQQQSWVIIKGLFAIRWPPEEHHKESYTEKWEVFETHNFDITDLGTKVELIGRKRQAHDVYADELYSWEGNAAKGACQTWQ
ncbi:hypothetical protein K439DRAFT_1616784 [Ramaria rubella]|nr:hypothetical protein K439DRAFT_1616784 [Ramaria rubella]